MKMTTLITLSTLLVSSTYAASTSTLLLNGTVALVNDISVAPNAKAITLNIIAGEAAADVAVVSETSNDLAGYIIQVSSTNAGKLKHSVDPTKMTGYQLSYNGGTYLAPTTIPVTVKTVTSLTSLTTNNSDVLINVTAYPTAPAGNYSDTVTFSIVAN